MLEEAGKYNQFFYTPEGMIRIRWWLPIVGICYLLVCFAFSGAVLLAAIAGTTGELGEYIPWLHWPVKLLAGVK